MGDIDLTRIVNDLQGRNRTDPSRLGLVLKRLFFGVRLRALEPFYFQLGTMLSSGVPIQEALCSLAEQNRGRARRVFGGIASRVSAGHHLAPALEVYPETFDRFAVAMVRTGEMAGRLDDNLLLLGNTVERFRNIRSKVITALLYPLLLLHLGILIPNLLILVKKGLGPYVVVCLSTLIPVYAVVFCVWLGHQYLRLTRWYSEFLLGMFLFGTVAKKIALARFSRALASLHDAGVDLGTSVETAAEASSNGAIRETFEQAATHLRLGNTLTDSLVGARYITDLARNMIRTGEQTGRLGETLNKLADYYDHESWTAIERMARIIPIILYLMIAGYIAYQVISFYMGYYGPYLTR